MASVPNDQKNQPESGTPSPVKIARSAEADVQPYVWAALGLLAILVTAILAPDWMNYQVRMKELEEAKKPSAGAPTASVPATGAPATGVPATGVPATGALPGGNSSRSIEKKDEKKPAIENSDIFETYGKLITMLLGFVSVLGVFVGYFIRKSLREIQDDIYNDVEKRMTLWEREKDMVFKELNDTRAKFNELTTTLDECKRCLRVLQEEAKVVENMRKGSATTSTSAIITELDNDPALTA